MWPIADIALMWSYVDIMLLPAYGHSNGSSRRKTTMQVHTPAELGTLLRQHRLDRGWTQAELARRAHVSRELVIRAENGHSRLELEKLFCLLKALGQSLDGAEDPVVPEPSLDERRGWLN